jgi:twitching motility protein PilT
MLTGAPKFDLRHLLEVMSERGSSDLLLTVGTPPQFRVNGSLQPYGDTPVDAETTRQMADSLLNEEQRQTLRDNKSIDLSKGFEGLSRFRINIYHQRESVALAIRIIPFRVPSFNDLGLPLMIREFAALPHGLVLITGPAGSGKSTTLAAMINQINQERQAHIICIEDPIEYLHDHGRGVIDQIEILADATSFTSALRSVFRQSPDVIMIGEMRDLETIQLALTLAETGHLILATLHTQDTTHAINRIVDAFPPEQQQQIYVQLALVLEGVVSQQLIATLDGSRRVLACEVMKVNSAIRNLVRERQLQQIYSVIQTGRAEGMATMNESLLQLCRRGLIERSEALRRSPRPKELGRLLETLPVPVA